MSFTGKIDDVLLECSNAVDKWHAVQGESLQYFSTLINIKKQLDSLLAPSVEKTLVLNNLADVVDQLLVKEVHAFNNLVVKIQRNVEVFLSVVATMKRLRKRAWRLYNQGDIPVTACVESSATSFSICEKLSWIDILERLYSEEVAVKEGLLSSITGELSASSLSELMEQWKREQCLITTIDVVERMRYSAQPWLNK
eukprot:scpid3972/ scgid20627/ 